MEYGKRLMEFIEKFNTYARSGYGCKEAEEFFRIYELELAKALFLDFPEQSIKISKMILALNDISDIKIKFE